ncbi:hypothetical protein RRG08_016818 [Elysia crispata]|uniref:Uncharacterized protein n=1 Tax=Elysia crispata TaxID=231223 RepID=A0AAE0ZZA7_9GAST|nr:hypothetical protein RRG08_016818 [Elysia crispata]
MHCSELLHSGLDITDDADATNRVGTTPGKLHSSCPPKGTLCIIYMRLHHSFFQRSPLYFPGQDKLCVALGWAHRFQILIAQDAGPSCKGETPYRASVGIAGMSRTEPAIVPCCPSSQWRLPGCVEERSDLTKPEIYICRKDSDLRTRRSISGLSHDRTSEFSPTWLPVAIQSSAVQKLHRAGIDCNLDLRLNLCRACINTVVVYRKPGLTSLAKVGQIVFYLTLQFGAQDVERPCLGDVLRDLHGLTVSFNWASYSSTGPRIVSRRCLGDVLRDLHGLTVSFNWASYSSTGPRIVSRPCLGDVLRDLHGLTVSFNWASYSSTGPRIVSRRCLGDVLRDLHGLTVSFNWASYCQSPVSG